MLQALTALLAPPMMERLTLVINHVLASESVATERLKPHQGRTLRLHLQRWPTLLPAPPALAMRVTPAGLLEWCGAEPPAEADLELRVDAPNPALLGMQWLAGETPAVELQGDAALAGDVNWLIANLRWDVEADLERLFGARLAHELARAGGGVARGLRRALQGGAGLASSLRPADRGR